MGLEAKAGAGLAEDAASSTRLRRPGGLRKPGVLSASGGGSRPFIEVAPARRDAAITQLYQHLQPHGNGAAGLLARNAVARGLTVPPTVKTSLAPGSRAVTDYLRGAGLLDPLAKPASTWSATAAPVHRQQRTRSTTRWPRRSRRTTWSSRPCSRATATSGSDSPARAASYLPRRAGRRLRAGRNGRRRPWRRSRSLGPRRCAGYLKDLWPSAEGSSHDRRFGRQWRAFPDRLRVRIRRRFALRSLDVPAADR